MKRADIRAMVDHFLARLGFERGTWLWQGATLLVVIHGKVMAFRFRAGTSAKNINLELGRLAGIRDTLKLLGMWEPARQVMNGSIASLNGHADVGLVGMPA